MVFFSSNGQALRETKDVKQFKEFKFCSRRVLIFQALIFRLSSIANILIIASALGRQEQQQQRG